MNVKNKRNTSLYESNKLFRFAQTVPERRTSQPAVEVDGGAVMASTRPCQTISDERALVASNFRMFPSIHAKLRGALGKSLVTCAGDRGVVHSFPCV